MSKERDFLDDMTATDAAVSGETRNEQVEATQAAVEAVAKGDKQEPAKPESTTATPAAEVKKDDVVPLAALMAERDTRKKERDRADALERQLQEFQSKQPQQPFYEDPEGFVKRHVDQTSNQLRQQFLASLEEDAREQNSDYDEVLDFLKERAQENPVLVQQVFQSPNPARAAYKLGKQLQEMDKLKDPAAYRQQIEAQVRAQVEAEFKAKEDARRNAVDALPPDLANSRSATASTQTRPGSVFENLF